MIKGFSFERNLQHQNEAVNSLIDSIKEQRVIKSTQLYSNNIIDFSDLKTLKNNIKEVQKCNELNMKFSNKPYFDIQMETGTGKTYTYTKTIFELNKFFGIKKFILVVPTLAIKAGAINFLKSKSAIEHFKTEYNKKIKVHVVDSNNSNKNQKDYFPPAISDFVRSIDPRNIDVLIINSGMINSKTIAKKYDTSVLDEYQTPIKGIQACKVITIIDEPHKFPTAKKTFKNILNFKSQLIIRYGATFNNEYYNLLYKLDALKAFNLDLVKGIKVHVDKFETGKNNVIRLVEIDGKEAKFEVIKEQSKKEIYKLAENDFLSLMHSEIANIKIEKLDKKMVVLSNGLELKKGEKINPYSLSETIATRMLKKAIKNHFKLERDYLTRKVKIKPITLFFIDDISTYRNEEEQRSLANQVELLIESEIKNILETEKNEWYKDYLKRSINNLSDTHGGYFSKDNLIKDEKIEQEINEIIHDKEKLIDKENIRRFIFSKWTLKEGWDNPNIFQIVKLRSSGSETSKLQEVGRGLRIPVNEYMERIKNEQFDLHYFVDFTEEEFVNTLKNEIQKDNLINYNTKGNNKISNEIITNILQEYPQDFSLDRDVLECLQEKNIIDKQNKYTENGKEKIEEFFPHAFKSLKENKISNVDEESNKINIRRENYNKLKQLWEEINKKVIIEYKFENEENVVNLMYNSLIQEENKKYFQRNNLLISTTNTLDRKSGEFHGIDNVYDDNTTITTLNYGEFILKLGRETGLNLNSIHQAFIKLDKVNHININKFLSIPTIRQLAQAFKNYLISNVKVDYEINYQKVSNKIHPTSLTKENGEALEKVDASKFGKYVNNNARISDRYLLDKCFYDSELEHSNINLNQTNDIESVVVFTKIPKGSIKIPIVGGLSYSPDFAYVIERKNKKKQLHLVIETKGKGENDLSEIEKIKINSAANLYSNSDYDIKFEKQLKNTAIHEIIKEIIGE